MQHFTSEDDFENSVNSPEKSGVAINQKHAYKTVVVKDHNSYHDLKVKELTNAVFFKPDTSPIDGGREEEASPSESIPSVPGPAKNLDKINNLVQKEIALGRVGVTREKAYRVIAQALDAKRWMDVVDSQGNVKQEYVDDLDKQRWGAEMAIKMFGDMIERKEIEMDVGDKTLDRLRALSVSELKARATDLLLGKKNVLSSVTDAEVVRG